MSSSSQSQVHSNILDLFNAVPSTAVPSKAATNNQIPQNNNMMPQMSTFGNPSSSNGGHMPFPDANKAPSNNNFMAPQVQPRPQPSEAPSMNVMGGGNVGIGNEQMMKNDSSLNFFNKPQPQPQQGSGQQQQQQQQQQNSASSGYDVNPFDGFDNISKPNEVANSVVTNSNSGNTNADDFFTGGGTSKAPNGDQSNEAESSGDSWVGVNDDAFNMFNSGKVSIFLFSSGQETTQRQKQNTHAPSPPTLLIVPCRTHRRRQHRNPRHPCLQQRIPLP